ncbi:MAG: hypothetical protein LBE13_08850 [Bacteroidales bacterium]|jgi:hypothetical protein|nr:hypothetical protein [Bacteroidales bacterium]
MIKKTVWTMIFMAVFFCSCNSKKETNTTENFELKEETLPYTVACSHLPKDSIKILSNELVNQLFRDLKNHQGHRMNIAVPLPEEWGVECKLTPMSVDFDIWIIANKGEPVIKFLATVQTDPSGIPSIIQAIPVACNTGVEKVNFIESEQWSAIVNDDYKIIVTKVYEKLYSLIDTLTTDNESVIVRKEDVYYIENTGRITYEVPPSFNMDYRAIIQFADTAITGNILDERWLWNTIDIQEVVEPMGILFGIITDHFDKADIYNYRGEKIDIIDISSFLNKHNMGFLAIKKGEKPLFIPYSSSAECLQKAFKYFELEYEFQDVEYNALQEEEENDND